MRAARKPTRDGWARALLGSVASVGHLAVGLALGRFAGGRTPRESVALSAMLAGLALLPDADVVGFGFGVRYAETWGHRGASHSLVFALLVSLVFGAVARSRGLALGRSTGLAFLAIGSHGALDAMTTGGLGCAIFWPFDDHRHFFGWRPIPVAPLGLGILAPRGLALMATEALLFLPFWVVAFWPRRTRLREAWEGPDS